MGSKGSKSPELSPFLNTPWREINWKDKQSALQYVKNYKPHIDGRQLRILLHGPVGAGKSSFINSVKSVLRGKMCALALVDNTSAGCFTNTTGDYITDDVIWLLPYTTYKIEKETPNTFHPFVFNDIMGLDSTRGVLVDDVKLALKGHVKENYKFNPESKLSEGDQFYNATVNPNDTVDVLVCVIPADTAHLMTDKTLRKIREIRTAASRLGIPQVAILTKIDQTCPEIKEDLRTIYMSANVKEEIEQFSVNVGIPMNCIFPVKNYSEEIDLNDDTDSLILSALKHIINFGEDFMNHKMNQAEGSHGYA